MAHFSVFIARPIKTKYNSYLSIFTKLGLYGVSELRLQRFQSFALCSPFKVSVVSHQRVLIEQGMSLPQSGRWILLILKLISHFFRPSILGGC